MSIELELGFKVFEVNENGISYEVEHISKYMVNVFSGRIPVDHVKKLVEARDKREYLFIKDSCEYDPNYGLSLYTDNGNNFATIIGDRKASEFINELKAKIA